jgi:hypothetical protein
MPIHSDAECMWGAGVMCLLGKKLDVQNVLHSIQGGNETLNCDFLIDGDAYEYDEKYYHEKNDRDIRKTEKLLRKVGKVVRMRRGADSLNITNNRYVEIRCDSYKTIDQLRSTAESLNLPFMDENSMRHTIQCGKDAFRHIDQRTKTALKTLSDQFGETVLGDPHGLDL